ncbi:precorrin-6y C5,15-methyltransferase (decarboxylating) subunit CbiE [Planomonospora parontospora subsp. parontospora]|uniref:Precorrin-6y C5,15-methyltransferase (Decarboxylating) subunit CbiE n=2 Tax=Planomonospora parontospora TaxID=58119 RepID=A0AA37BLJ2_9ACTN|nr:precorrin-6y C5,15-methyltransferase (decarboxylating) subunit CbiE [Planomonospora parontospora]GGK88976.1 precorrin-6y C5,15-methyltransferase (decarboxylating) subunit CbiE [Planomonospora parontospora]GII11651.1 precorrin-6y C5,15-methyltransferase (decarboxylating) subunit CbiE [Planomonospora parontospora subsp. parontospora]
MITVVGVDGRALSPLARARLEEATVLAGSDRLLERVRPLPGGARVVGGPLGRAVEAHREHGGRLVVLAAGDPGFFGAVAELRGHGVVPEVLPAPSLVSRAFAGAGLAWEDALVVTGERLDRVANACRAHHKVAVLAAPGVGPAEIARELAPTTPRALIVCEDLGGPDERITHSRMGEATTRPWKNPEVVLVLDPLHRGPDEPAWAAGARPGPPGWARDFAGAGLDPVVRAFALARLGPRLGDLVWDVGAGGGEIAVECALLGAAVVAVEPEEEACARLRRNVIAHGVKVALTRGRAPAALEPLAAPDAVFVGGGGVEAVAACAARGPRSLVCALRTAEQADAVLEVLREHGYRVESVRIEASRTAGGNRGEAEEGHGEETGGDGAGHRAPASGPIFVVCAAGRGLEKIIAP